MYTFEGNCKLNVIILMIFIYFQMSFPGLLLGYDYYGSGFYTGKTKHFLLLWEAETGEIGTVEYLIEALMNIKQQQLAWIIQNFCKSQNNGRLALIKSGICLQGPQVKQ